MRLFIKTFFILFFSFSNYAQDVTCKCCDEKHDEFNFWLGTWTVTNTDGEVVGKNVIDKIQDNCILRENWTSAQGTFTGTSNNFYNNVTKQWEQIWIDNQGGSLHLKGHRVANQMILKTDIANNKEGKPFYHRITWTLNDDGSVRQYWETITNDKDISVVFDGLYRKQ
ncbi:hypothetical protein [Flavivirga rizhaonensis]|uniref:DUF1579 domain-containing protein n=1 Tax=Flavivirga rizhaonensis TaxID=2559571 RepID=A0A4S1DYJ3_9FLAO|nr:hypothetical protein [Flavivirga rizhaonensis]TGV03045.1 hypothetical protein EM932_08660 [Flavivirga rizhaonensis]